MIGWMAIAAVSAADPALGWLDTSAERAEAAIAACQWDRECTVSPEQLAEAFLVRALAAAAHHGELDERSVANAEALDPGSSARWSDLLPSPSTAPDPWVLLWIDETRPPAAQIRPRTRRPLRNVVRADLAWLSGFRSGWATSLEGRASVGRLGIGISGGYEARRIPANPLDGYVLISIVEHLRTARLAVGPRWVSGKGGEAFVFVAAGIDSFAVRPGVPAVGQYRAASYFNTNRLWVGQVGALGVVPLERTGTVALRLDGSAETREGLEPRYVYDTRFPMPGLSVYLPRNGFAVRGAWDLLFRLDGQLQVGFGYAARFGWYAPSRDWIDASNPPGQTGALVSSSVRSHVAVRF